MSVSGCICVCVCVFNETFNCGLHVVEERLKHSCLGDSRMCALHLHREKMILSHFQWWQGIYNTPRVVEALLVWRAVHGQVANLKNVLQKRESGAMVWGVRGKFLEFASRLLSAGFQDKLGSGVGAEGKTERWVRTQNGELTWLSRLETVKCFPL